MARVNVGLNPRYLSDQHLIAESVEITMITGSLRKDGYQIKGQVPDKFCLGTGHINFFKPKLNYLRLRLREVNDELERRGFKHDRKIADFGEFFNMNLTKNWTPSQRDSNIVKERIIDRLKNPLRAKPGFHKYYGKPIENMNDFCEKINESELYFV